MTWTPPAPEPTYLQPGDRITVELPYSEVCMYLGLAGKRRTIELLKGGSGMVQIYHDNGKPLSYPITHVEAGIYLDERGRYYTYA